MEGKKSEGEGEERKKVRTRKEKWEGGNRMDRK